MTCFRVKQFGMRDFSSSFLPFRSNWNMYASQFGRRMKTKINGKETFESINLVSLCQREREDKSLGCTSPRSRKINTALSLNTTNDRQKHLSGVSWRIQYNLNLNISYTFFSFFSSYIFILSSVDVYC